MTQPAAVILHELPPSPNNVRVRLALRYKGIAFESRPVSFSDADRKELIALSTQPLTPVIQHGDVVLFDSSAILRYLDANFPDTKRLFSTSRDEMREIESWEYFARTELIRFVGLIFDQAFADRPDESVIGEANRLLMEGTGRIEKALVASGGPWLLGGRLTAADLFCAPLVVLGMLRDAPEGSPPVVHFFRKHLQLGEGRDHTRAWVSGVMALESL